MSRPTEGIAVQSELNADEFNKIVGLVREFTGIDLPPHKKTMVAGRLSKRLKATCMESVSSYIAYLNSPEGDGERSHFINAYTTNMTRFNREDHHFSFFAKAVMPRLARAARKGMRVRLWSAGCSSGEEPFQLAFHVLDACPEASKLDLKLLATDIDSDILAVAQAGIYPRAHTSSLPGDHMSRYFEPVGSSSDRVRVVDAARALISFRTLNLHSTWPFKGGFDVIMCRNVAIYFDAETQEQLWHRLGSRVLPAGMLFLGHSETLSEECARQFKASGPGIFQRNATEAAARPVMHVH
ncbi:chemotaxis protein [Roseovarius faecimaris]|uniref:Chemotaxis protein methyltransferase n=1 Tax=Roseovarius faecimaris TaxID=2494550 RepID=A0A6I6IW17_9RHOB|nr:CheR family methyltransferase [Roseovarius faecimaris]QGX99687.1 chemotaxis protein [Roseovarius faecimaris]